LPLLQQWCSKRLKNKLVPSASIPHAITRKFWLLGGFFAAAVITAITTGWYWMALLPFVLLAAWPVAYNLQLLFYALLFCIPLSVEVQITPSLGTDFPDELLLMVLTVLGGWLVLLRPASLSKSFYTHPLTGLLLIHIVWIGVSTLFSTDVVLSLKYLLAKIWYVVPFVVLPQIFLKDKKSFRIGFGLMMIAMLLIVIQTLIRHYGYGFSFEKVNDAITPLFRNHVNYAAMLVCMIPLLLAALQFAKTRWMRRLLFGAFVIAMAGIVLSYSRGAWLALITGAIAWWAIRKKLMIWLIGISMVIVAAVFSWLADDNRYLRYAHNYNQTIFHTDFSEHIAATIAGKDVSTAERFYRWIGGVRMAAEKPFTGFGPNTFYEHYQSYTVTDFRTWVSDNPEHSTVHNYFLLLAAEQGIPGLIIFTFMLLAMLLYAEKNYHHQPDHFYRTVALCTGIVLVMITTVNLLSDLVETDKIGSLFFLGLGILVLVGNNVRR
jgi:O-antigen ligase